MILLRTGALFILTAIAEILGCYLPYLWLKQGRSAWVLLPGAASLASFAGLLTLHATSTARTCAAYGGVYIAVAILWLWGGEKQQPTRCDLLGAIVARTGMAIIMLGPRR